MEKTYTIVVRSNEEKHMEGFRKDLLKLLEKWDEIVVVYNGGVA